VRLRGALMGQGWNASAQPGGRPALLPSGGRPAPGKSDILKKARRSCPETYIVISAQASPGQARPSSLPPWLPCPGCGLQPRQACARRGARLRRAVRDGWRGDPPGKGRKKYVLTAISACTWIQSDCSRSTEPVNAEPQRDSSWAAEICPSVCIEIQNDSTSTRREKWC